MRQLYNVRIFNSTPFTNQNNSVYFNNQKDMFDWFTSKFNWLEWKLNVNYDTVQFKVPVKLEEITGYNYGVIYDPTNLTNYRYFFIGQTLETNNGVTTIIAQPDVAQTLSYGTRIQEVLGYSTISRQHPESNNELRQNIKFYTSNDDLLSSTSNIFNIKQWSLNFFKEGLYIIFTTTVDLNGDAGDKDKPNLTTSNGQTYDKITSPQNLYISTEENYTEMMKALSSKPWISRNITMNTKIPAMFIDENDIEDAPSQYGALKKFKNNSTSSNVSGIIGIPLSEIRLALNLDSGGLEDYMLRYPYTYLEINNNQGQSFDIKFEDLDTTNDNIVLDSKTMFGYDNQISIYPRQYLSDNENTLDNFVRGDGLGLSITWKTWDSIATLLDNYKLTEASSAYTRNLAQSRTLVGRFNDISSRDSSLADKFSDAMDLGGVAMGMATPWAAMSTQGRGGRLGSSLLSVGSRINDDHMKMQDINAQLENSKISSPTLMNQNYNNTFATANGIFGLQIKLKRINKTQFNNIKLYHKLFGFDYHAYAKLNKFNMSIVNYVKSSTDHLQVGPDILPQWVPALSVRFDAGIKFWKPTENGYDVFNQDISDNRVL